MIQLLIILLGYVQALYVGEAACSTFTASQVNCEASGYCKYVTTPAAACVDLNCYLVNEVAACRSGPTGSGIPVGALSTKCDSLEQFSLQYDNVCVDKGDGKLNYAFVRFTKTLDGSAIATTGNTAIAIGSLTAVADNMFPLYTLNPWKIPEGGTNDAATLKTQLEAILQKYLDFGAILVDTTNSHPFYLERTTYQALQLIRDYPGYTKVNRIATLTKIWQVAELALLRIVKFSPAYYQTNYYFINFASVPYSRRELTVNGQLHTVKIDWTGYSYTANGYMQVYSYPPEQFGIRNALTDVIALRPITTIASPYVANSPLNLDTGFTNFFFEWTWADTNLVVVPGDLKLYQFDESAAAAADVVKQVAGVTFTCTLTTRTCKFAAITTTVITASTKRINYYISYGPGKCVDKTEVQCNLSIEQSTVCAYNSALTTDYKCA